MRAERSQCRSKMPSSTELSSLFVSASAHRGCGYHMRRRLNLEVTINNGGKGEDCGGEPGLLILAIRSQSKRNWMSSALLGMCFVWSWSVFPRGIIRPSASLVFPQGPAPQCLW